MFILHIHQISFQYSIKKQLYIIYFLNFYYYFLKNKNKIIFKIQTKQSKKKYIQKCLYTTLNNNLKFNNPLKPYHTYLNNNPLKLQIKPLYNTFNNLNPLFNTYPYNNNNPQFQVKLSKAHNLYNNKLLNPLKVNLELNIILLKEDKLNINKLKNKQLNKLNKQQPNTYKKKEELSKEYPEKQLKLITKLLNTKKNMYPEFVTTLFKNKFPYKLLNTYPYKKPNMQLNKQPNILLNLNKFPELNMMKLNTKQLLNNKLFNKPPYNILLLYKPLFNKLLLYNKLLLNLQFIPKLPFNNNLLPYIPLKLLLDLQYTKYLNKLNLNKLYLYTLLLNQLLLKELLEIQQVKIKKLNLKKMKINLSGKTFSEKIFEQQFNPCEHKKQNYNLSVYYYLYFRYLQIILQNLRYSIIFFNTVKVFFFFFLNLFNNIKFIYSCQFL